MLTLLAFFELLRLHFQRIMHWVHTPHCSHYRRKLAQPVDRRNHRHTPQKPEWLKAEITGSNLTN